jgi:hypothetical protein
MKSRDNTVDDAQAGPPDPAGASGDQATGLPWVDTWRGVYAFVFISFLIWVGLLVALTVIFS